MSTGSAPPAVCNDSVAEVGEICLGTAAQVAQSGTPPLRLADVDGDTRTDFVAIQGVFLQKPEGAFGLTPMPEFTGLPPGLGEFDGDGRIDVFTYDYELGEVHRLRGEGDATFGEQFTSKIGQVLGLKAVDLDDDGRDELIGLGSAFEGPIEAWSAQADGSFIPFASYPFSGTNVEVADLDGDGQQDLAIPSVDVFHLRWGASGFEFMDGVDVMHLGLSGLSVMDSGGNGGAALILAAYHVQPPAQTLNRVVLAWPGRGSADSWPFVGHDLPEEQNLLEMPAYGDMNADGRVDLLLLLRDFNTGVRSLDVLCQTDGLAFSVCAAEELAVDAVHIHPLHANSDPSLDLLLATEEQGVWLMLAEP